MDMIERLNITCYKLKRGECGPCGVAQIVNEKIAQTTRGEELKVAQRVQKDYCPLGVNMDIPKRPEPPIWQV